MKKNMVWIKGTCKLESVQTADDFCNQMVVKGGEYCEQHTCIVGRCKEKASIWYPLLGIGKSEPRFCSKHHTPKYASSYGCNLSPRDCFDPYDGY